MVINRLKLNLSMLVNKHGTVMDIRVDLLSSPELKAPGEVASVVHRCPSTFSKDFSSETTGSISFKFHT